MHGMQIRGTIQLRRILLNYSRRDDGLWEIFFEQPLSVKRCVFILRVNLSFKPICLVSDIDMVVRWRSVFSCPLVCRPPSPCIDVMRFIFCGWFLTSLGHTDPLLEWPWTWHNLMHTIQSKLRQSDVLNISHSTFLKLDLMDHLQAVNAGAGKKLMLV